MNPQKRATPDHPIHELLANRWSPYGFSDRPVSRQDLLSLDVWVVTGRFMAS